MMIYRRAAAILTIAFALMLAALPAELYRPHAVTGYGWPVLTSKVGGPLPTLRRWRLPGTDVVIPLRDGSVGFVLLHFALYWHRKAEALTGGIRDEWGHAIRPTRGQTSGYSEHAGGCAEDLNATRHPRGVPIVRTFTSIKLIRLRARLLTFRASRFRRPVIGLGLDYKRTPDGMHAEIRDGATLAEVEAVARRLMTTPYGREILKANPGAREAILA